KGSHDGVTQSLIDQYNAQQKVIDQHRAMVDPIFAVRQAEQKARDAVDEYNAALARTHGEVTPEVLDAYGKMVEANNDLEEATLRAGRVNLNDLRDELVRSATSMGITKEEAEKMADAIIGDFGRINAAILQDKT